ncbi:MAG TPA: ATP-binding protein [Terracidiphilus sp.]|jgi:signal transduction histidine kinase
MTANRLRFMVVAPLGRDAELIAALLNASGYGSERMESIADAKQAGTAMLLGLILTDEALTKNGLEALRTLIDAQPQWSDLPVILLTSGPGEPRRAVTASQVRMQFRSVFLLDRPVRKELLLSAVQVAYNSRLKQLEVRDAAMQQYQSEETLRNAEKLATAGRLVATMAHEVNNPLEALGNLLFLIEHSPTIDDARAFSRKATQELERISEIVNQTLGLHRAPAKPAITEIAELATSALTLFRGKLRERKIVECVTAEPTLAFCSAGEVRQAVVNLIGNALDAMPEGGRLYLRVSSATRKGALYARLTVADTGSGIPAAIRPNLFNQFFTTKGSRGTGLGLWLTRDIVIRNAGRLRYRSRTGSPSGTVFTLYLPAVAPAARAHTDAGHPQGDSRSEEAA